MKNTKKLFLLVLTMLPIASVAFAAKSALSMAMIRNGVASNADLQTAGPESIIRTNGKTK